MLTPEEKDKIKAEEVFRYQVRESLKEQTTSKVTSASKAYTFLSGPLGLWLLSSVFISLFSWAYTELTAQRKSYKDAAFRHMKIFDEISYRTYSLNSLFTSAIPVESLDAHELKDVVNGVICGSDYRIKGYNRKGYLLLEYKNEHIDALAYQLDRVQMANPELPNYSGQINQDFGKAFKKVKHQLHRLTKELPSLDTTDLKK